MQFCLYHRVYRFVNGSAYFHTIAEHVAHDNSSSSNTVAEHVANDNSSSSNIDAERVAHDNSNCSHTYPRDLSTTGQFTTISLCGAGDREEECMQGKKEEGKTEKAQQREER